LSTRGIETVAISALRNSLPSDYKKANLNREELVDLGNRVGASLVYFGLVSPGSKGQIYHGQWIQVPAARILEEVQGEADKKAAVVDAIMTPVRNAQSQGTLNTKPFKLTIKGRFTPKQLE